MILAYIYPISARYHGRSKNPYLENFMDYLQDKISFVNRYAPSSSGILDFVLYIHKVRYLFLHWPENIAEKKMGFLQSIIFVYILIPLIKIRKIKIVYVVHNKLSHTPNRICLKKLITRKLLKNSTLIITHAKEGIDFIHSMVKNQTKVLFFPHPVDKPLQDIKNAKKEIDILIWGNIAPYKGIDRFLKLLKEDNFERWKVVIAGNISSEGYMHQLNALKPDNVQIINEFLDDLKIEQLISRSRLVLFPYHAQSVLSSGAFSKTLAFPVKIIGPNCGAFADFSQLENVSTFDSEKEIFKLLIEKLNVENETLPYRQAMRLIKKYSWQNFGIQLLSNI